VAMSIIGLVVEINSEDFNVASVLSSIDRKRNSGGASGEASSDNLVLAAGGDASGFNVDSAGHKWSRRKSPLTVDDFSEGSGGDRVLASQVLEILGRRGSLGISGISGVSSSERSRLTTSSINTNNGDCVGGGRCKTWEVELLEEGGVRPRGGWLR